MRKVVVVLSVLSFSVAITGCHPSVDQQRAQARAAWKHQMSAPVDSGGAVAASNK